ncbi:MAG: DUF1311 domain-containing protein [Silicimonas sp.]|nr:DUF1311 domain-containing protein [Silicimonas sp.]
MRLASILCVAVGAASPAFATELSFSPEATEACLADATTIGTQADCIGASAAACYSPEGVYSNYAIGACFALEADLWDRRLNDAYRALLAVEAELVANVAESDIRLPDTAAALREMQRAWIPYRDAACWYEYTTWGGGTGGGPGNAECLMRLTGQKALELEARLKERGE